VKVEAKISDEGFSLVVSEGGDRVRLVSWRAVSDESMDSGVADVSMIPRGSGAPVFLGWRPSRVEFELVRDPTPGVHQPFISYIPAGVSVLEFFAETDVAGAYGVQVSGSGHPHDGRSMGQLPRLQAGSKGLVKIVSSTTWSKLFVKKNDAESRARVCLSRFKLTTASGEEFRSLAHLIKPEGVGISRSGGDGIVFSQDARRWCYASIAFHRS
jgi:hypothetical protein